MGSNFNNYMTKQTRGHRREPKEMNVRQIIWKLIKLWFKHGNLPVRSGYNIKGGAICMNPNMKDIYLLKESLYQFIKVWKIWCLYYFFAIFYFFLIFINKH